MRNHFDNLAKELLAALLSEGGTAQIEREISVDAHRIDVWFMPGHPPGTVPSVLAPLARENAVIEPFHDPPDVEDVQRCVLKQHAMFAALRRGKAPKDQLPALWILSAGVPRNVIRAFGFEPMKGALRGFLTSPQAVHRLHLVVISDLDRTRETLPLRLLGAGRTLQDALEDWQALPETALERVVLKPVLVRSGVETVMQPGRRKRDEEALMRAAEWAYNDTLREAREEGEARELKRQFERRLRRPLSVLENTALDRRLSALGPARLGDVAFDVSAAELARWLTDPEAR